MRNNKVRIVALVAVLLLVAGLIAYGATRNRQTDSTQPALTTASSIVPTSEAAPPPEPSSDNWPAECPTEPHPITNPVSFRVLSHDIDLPMISVGLDADGAAGAPPGNESHMVAWFNEGPAVGSQVGKVVLTSHTFQFGGAFGNELNDGLLEVGDVILITDASGESACYSYSGNTHIFVADYDPDSDIVYDYEGEPQFALVVCSDYTATGETLGRIIYYGDLMGKQPEVEVGQGTTEEPAAQASAVVGG